jgi:hypothetical protein
MVNTGRPRCVTLINRTVREEFVDLINAKKEPCSMTTRRAFRKELLAGLALTGTAFQSQAFGLPTLVGGLGSHLTFRTPDLISGELLSAQILLGNL